MSSSVQMDGVSRTVGYVMATTTVGTCPMNRTVEEVPQPHHQVYDTEAVVHSGRSRCSEDRLTSGAPGCMLNVTVIQGRRQVKKCGVDMHGECAEHEPITGSGDRAPTGFRGRAPG